METDNWKSLKGIDFSDPTILQYHIDTRDFCCMVSKEPLENIIDLSKIKKYPDRFFFTPEEVKETILRLYNESGGECDWRMLSLKDEGQQASSGWQLKYLRILRTELGMVICNKDYYVLSKAILNSEVNKRHLGSH